MLADAIIPSIRTGAPSRWRHHGTVDTPYGIHTVESDEVVLMFHFCSQNKEARGAQLNHATYMNMTSMTKQLYVSDGGERADVRLVRNPSCMKKTSAPKLLS